MELAEKIEERVIETMKIAVKDRTDFSFLDLIHRDIFGAPLSAEYYDYALDKYSEYLSDGKNKYNARYDSVRAALSKMVIDFFNEKKSLVKVSEDLSGLSRT
ncbi:MAG: hypothetical protein KKB62_02625 [Nanoarchaeota archaeon]|nr:hypothetical protein [Nanoarchaeota archaeon]